MPWVILGTESMGKPPEPLYPPTRYSCTGPIYGTEKSASPMGGPAILTPLWVMGVDSLPRNPWREGFFPPKNFINNFLAIFFQLQFS